MGQEQSSMTCVDAKKKCTYNIPIPISQYNTYAKTLPQTDANRQKKLNDYVCKNNVGDLMQCCDPNGANANEIAKGSKLINPIMDASGNITEYQICNCTTQQCKDDNCKGFRQPTNYEWCRSTPIKASDLIHVDAYIDRVLEPKTYPNCYGACQK